MELDPALNGAGKTDLLLRIGNRNVLVGECKIWPGSKKFREESIPQLFGYLTRYDHRAVIPLFIRKARSEEIVAKAAKELAEHHAASPFPIMRIASTTS